MNHLILIVDDEPMTRDGMSRALAKWSEGRYEIVALDNGHSAMDMLQRESVELLITDIRMPEISGLDLVDAMEQKLDFRMPPVILISGYSEFEYAQRAIRLGVLNYLLKPVSNGKLIEAVEQALRESGKRNRFEVLERSFDPVLKDAGVHLRQSDVSDSVKEAVRYVDGHLDEPIGLQEVAERVHLNPSYFSVLFKEQVHVTFSEYLTRTRLQRAKELLLQSRLPIGEVAERVGYKSAKYFNKIFKEYEGHTPGQYRSDRTEET